MRKQLAALGLATVVGCGGSSSPDVLKNVDSLLILQRTPRMGGVGDVFQYTSYVAGARLVKLDPPTADGKITELCCAQFGDTYKDIDIMAYDLSFDARSIVISAKLNGGQRYGLFMLTLNDAGEVSAPPTQLATDPNRDYVYPVFAAEDRIVFVTNSVVEEGAPQHVDEYERGETTQLGSISADGTGEILGPRNLSHRVSPTMLHTGQVLFTQWDHLGDENSGHLMMTNPDFTNLREVFGKEGTGRTNSYLKAIEFPTSAAESANPDIRLVTIGTSRDRTLQSGKILDVRIGQRDAAGDWRQSEANSSFEDLTPLVPGDREPSQLTIGRYYDAYPVRADDGAAFSDKPYLVVSWADGPVEEETLAAAGLMADFGIYLYDSRTGTRRPIFNDPAKWDVLARPLAPRVPPKEIIPSASNGLSDTGALIGSLDVYQSSIATIAAGSVKVVRVLEGFSAEEGIPDDFGLTEHEGAALLGEALVHEDGSWAAIIPANVPIHLQAVDKFGMAIVNEPVWFSARPGEARFCGGCHEDRAATTVIQPGIPQAITAGPVDMDRPRAERFSTDYSRSKVVGIPWEDDQPTLNRTGRTAVQTILTTHCAECHDGDASKPGNRSITLTDTATGEVQTIVFDLRGGVPTYTLGGVMLSAYSRSHLSLLGPDMMELEEAGLEITTEGELPIYIVAGAAKSSQLFDKLNPPQLYPYDAAVRYKDGVVPHLTAVGRPDLSEDEYYLLILNADAGAQFYSRENAPSGIY